MVTCPLMVYEIAYCIGAPYRYTVFGLTFFAISTACFADAATSSVGRWTWFTFGCMISGLLFIMLYKVYKHSCKLNDKFSSNTHVKESMKQLKLDEENFPKGLINLKTPMDEKFKFIDIAFGLMIFMWPVFPLMFLLEYNGICDRNFTQVVFSVADLIIKTTHSYALDQYKIGLRQTVFPYGFLDVKVLYELDIWDDNHDIYAQLKGLSRSMYGDLLVGNKGVVNDLSSAGLDYQTLLIAGRVNRKVDNFSEADEMSEVGSVSGDKWVKGVVDTAPTSPSTPTAMLGRGLVGSPHGSRNSTPNGSSRNLRAVAPQPEVQEVRSTSPTTPRGALNRRASLSHFGAGGNSQRMSPRMKPHDVALQQGGIAQQNSGVGGRDSGGTMPSDNRQHHYEQPYDAEQQYGVQQQQQSPNRQQYGQQQPPFGQQQQQCGQQSPNGQQQQQQQQQYGQQSPNGQQQQQQQQYGQQSPNGQQQQQYGQQSPNRQPHGQQSPNGQYGQQQQQQQNNFGQQQQHHSSPNLQQMQQQNEPPQQQQQAQQQQDVDPSNAASAPFPGNIGEPQDKDLVVWH